MHKKDFSDLKEGTIVKLSESPWIFFNWKKDYKYKIMRKAGKSEYACKELCTGSELYILVSWIEEVIS